MIIGQSKTYLCFYGMFMMMYERILTITKSLNQSPKKKYTLKSKSTTLMSHKQ